MQNAYEKRWMRRKLLRETWKNNERSYNLATIQWRIKRAERAFVECFGIAKFVNHKNGWYWLDRTSYRASELDMYCDRMEVLIHIRENPPPEDNDA